MAQKRHTLNEKKLYLVPVPDHSPQPPINTSLRDAEKPTVPEKQKKAQGKGKTVAHPESRRMGVGEGKKKTRQVTDTTL